MTEKRWEFSNPDEDQVRALAQELGIRPLISRLLVSRGIHSYAEAEQFFNPRKELLHDPWKMKDMDLAVARIDQARKNKEKVLIYGDYDVDGTSAVALVYLFLQQHGSLPLDYYIPHRYREGYGLSKAGMEYARDHGYTLIIALDCGIKSHDLIALAKDWGIDVIVCDHHLPDQTLPPAYAILNPKQAACPYPYKELSGCGIGYKLTLALEETWELPQGTADRQLDLVATSIAADLVPLDGENRILAWKGLKKVNDNPNPGIRHLIELAGIHRDLKLSDLVFVVGPRVNAAGRMDDARKAVDMFVSPPGEKIKELAASLNADNKERQETDRSISLEALSLLEKDPAEKQRYATVLYKEAWHKGVIGIVASRLLDYYYRPTVVLCGSEGKVSGSCRSVHDFNIYEAIHACRDLLDNYGGHFYAAGLTMAPENVAPFRQRFEEVVAQRIQPEQRIPRITIDAEIRLRDIRRGFYRTLSRFEPFGPQNPNPVFLCRNLRDFQRRSCVVKDQHLQFALISPEGDTIMGIGFRMAEAYPLLCQGPIDIVFHIDEHHYQKQASLQIRVLDLKPAGTWTG